MIGHFLQYLTEKKTRDLEKEWGKEGRKRRETKGTIGMGNMGRGLEDDLNE